MAHAMRNAVRKRQRARPAASRSSSKCERGSCTGSRCAPCAVIVGAGAGTGTAGAGAGAGGPEAEAFAIDSSYAGGGEEGASLLVDAMVMVVCVIGVVVGGVQLTQPRRTLNTARGGVMTSRSPCAASASHQTTHAYIA